MNQTLVFLVILVYCWTLNPFLKKKIAGKLSADEYMVFNHGLCTIFIVLYLVYLLFSHKYNIKSVQELSSTDIIIALVGALVTVISSIVLISLLQNNEASYIIPHVQPCVIVLTMFIGYLFFHESISRNKIIGTILIALGLVYLNK